MRTNRILARLREGALSEATVVLAPLAEPPRTDSIVPQMWLTYTRPDSRKAFSLSRSVATAPRNSSWVSTAQ